jgi:twitching motility protein PilT
MVTARTYRSRSATTCNVTPSRPEIPYNAPVSDRLGRLLDYLDQPGVSELVLGIGRPIAIRADEGYRAVTPGAYARDQLDQLLAGTALDGMLGSAESAAPVEVEACARRLVVQVVRHAAEVALRIALARPAPSLEPRVTFARSSGTTPAAGTSPPMSRTVTPTTGLTARTTTPTAGVPVSRTVSPRTSTPPAGVSISRSVTPPAGVTMSRTATPTIAQGADNAITTGSTRSPVLEPAGEPEEFELAIPGPWTGPRIIDELANVSALVPLVRAARQAGATDLHLAAGRPIMIRRVGELVALDPDALPSGVPPGVRVALSGPLTAKAAQSFLLPLLGPVGRARLLEAGYVDLAADVPGAGRIRANVSRQQDGLCGTVRLIAQTTPSLEALGLPRELTKIVNHHQGLVVIAGPNGHGKTTTMAALVDLLNATRKYHIITVEDPVEIEHRPKLAIVSHREVNRHTLSFVTALKSSLREDPDVVVIGELRDAESVEIALTAAETGHLVLATMSTPSAAKTIDRLIDMFPPDEQPQVRSSVAGSLRGIIAQRLLPTSTEDGVVAATELVTGVLPLASLIRDNKLFQLPNLMQRGRAFGMIRLDESLLELVRAKRITEATALAHAENRKELALALAPAPTTPTPQPRGLFGRKGTP